MSGNRTSELRNRQVGLEFIRRIDGPLGRPGNMQGAERDGTGRVDLWSNWTDSWDESKLPRRRQRVASVGRDPKMKFWIPLGERKKASKGSPLVARKRCATPRSD